MVRSAEPSVSGVMSRDHIVWAANNQMEPSRLTVLCDHVAAARGSFGALPHNKPAGRYTRRHRMSAMPSKSAVVHSDPEILGGTPVFVGTRVPVKTLYDYLEAGDTLGEFLNDFPSVTREQAVAALELAREMTEAHAVVAR